MPSGYHAVTIVIHNVYATMLPNTKLLYKILRKLPSGYQVTRLPVTFVIHNVYATIKIMVTKWLLLYSKLF